MQSGWDYFEQRLQPTSNYSKVADMQSEMNFYDWWGKNLRKNGNFCTNLVNYTPSNGILSFMGFEIIFMMFIAYGFILLNDVLIIFPMRKKLLFLQMCFYQMVLIYLFLKNSLKQDTIEIKELTIAMKSLELLKSVIYNLLQIVGFLYKNYSSKKQFK